MADKIPVRIPVDLDRRRYFQLDLAAVIRWEGLTDKPFFSNKAGWKHFKKREDMAMMLWCCLVGDDPELKPRDIIQMLKDKKITPEVVSALIQLLNDAWVTLINSLVGGDNHGYQRR